MHPDSLFSSPGQTWQESSCCCCHRSTRIHESIITLSSVCLSPCLFSVFCTRPVFIPSVFISLSAVCFCALSVTQPNWSVWTLNYWSCSLEALKPLPALPAENSLGHTASLCATVPFQTLLSGASSLTQSQPLPLQSVDDCWGRQVYHFNNCNLQSF